MQEKHLKIQAALWKALALLFLKEQKKKENTEVEQVAYVIIVSIIWAFSPLVPGIPSPQEMQ